MNITHMSSIDHHGAFSKKRMHLQPMLPIPVNYATAAIPKFAPFGTEYTPNHTIKIVGGRRISIPNTVASNSKYPVEFSKKNIDPALAPTKTIQNIRANDSSQWQQQSRTRFDTTYRTEFINRIRHPEYTPWYQQTLPDQTTKVNRNTKSSINQYSVLPPISVSTKNNNTRSAGSASSYISDIQRPIREQEVPIKETTPKDIPPLNLNNGQQNIFDQQQQQSMMNNEDTYLPEEPVLLTDYEEQRLFEQIRNQLGNSTTVDKLKLFYQELTAYDPNVTSYIHYTNIQLVASQLGLNLQEDTFRFAMCKFVSPDQQRGFVNYEDMIRYFGKCLSSITPNQYGQQRNLSPKKNDYDIQKQNQTQMRFNNNDDNTNFDPDERRARVLLKQNLKFFDMNGTIDFDKLYRELKIADKNQSGVLNRQQIEEVVYKVRLPLQRSLLYQILEKHCKAYPTLYNWEAFIQYLKEQVLDLNQIRDRSSTVYRQNAPSRNQWLDQIRREFNENDRLRIINRYIASNEGPRLDNNHPIAWFTRFLRLANAMYGHRTSTNREQEFVLPREEARRLFRAYNHVWDLKIDEDRLQRVLDACGRNGNTGIDDALILFAKQT